MEEQVQEPPAAAAVPQETLLIADEPVPVLVPEPSVDSLVVQSSPVEDTSSAVSVIPGNNVQGTESTPTDLFNSTGENDDALSPATHAQSVPLHLNLFPPLSAASEQSLQPSLSRAPSSSNGAAFLSNSTSTAHPGVSAGLESSALITNGVSVPSLGSMPIAPGQALLKPPVSKAQQPPAKKQRVSTATSTTTGPTTAGGATQHNEHKIFYRAEEENGRVSFLVVTNDNTDKSLIWLINLKEIFAKQLPKMPREYIVRLLFDRHHQSLLCLEGDQVVGGISFRPFMEQKFAEIAFCAVSATHQIRGYGTRLMNHLKEYVKRVSLTHFLTYADNLAIGYFKKQGFSATISMPKERWMGYIKDYDGGTLMECVVHPQIDYFRIPDLIRRQKEFLLSKIALAKKADIVYPGLPLTRIEDPYSQIPGLKEAGWNKPVLTPVQSSNQALPQHLNTVASFARALVSGVIAGAELQIVLRGVIEHISQQKDAWPFQEPVPATVVDYLEIIREPIDLSLIRKRQANGVYKTAGHLRRDLQLMLDNCKQYNLPDSLFYKAAQVLQKVVNDIFGEIPPAT